ASLVRQVSAGVAARTLRRGAARRHAALPARPRRLDPPPEAARPSTRRSKPPEPARCTLDVEAACRASVRPRAWRSALRPRLRTGRVDFGLVRRQFELARTRVVSPQFPADRIAAEASLLSR